MTILLELDPETEARLRAQAELHGIALNLYASRLLKEAALPPTGGTGKLTLEEFHTMLRELAEGSENLPKLPTSAFNRESIYEEHL